MRAQRHRTESALAARLTPHRGRWLALGPAASAGLLATAFVLCRSHGGAVWWIVLWTVLWLSAAALGALLCARVPGNAIGWALLGMGLSQSAGFCLDAYSAPALGLPGRDVAAVAAALTEYLPVIVFVPALLLLFPNGRLPSPRWRGVVVAWAANVAVAVVASVVQPGKDAVNTNRDMTNPFALHGLVGDAAIAANAVSYILAGCLFLAAALSLVGRYRRSQGDVRLQLKWFACGASTLTIAAFASLPLTPNTPLQSSLWVASGTLTTWSIGIAVLRYRLYDIDVIVRRTIVYASLVAALAALYVAGLFVIDRSLQALTGQSSALAVTISTLLVVAVFQPLRHRIQRAVDRRFYRAKYDAVRTLEEFGGRLREQIDVAMLHADVLDVVRITLQPRHASLWLRPHIPRDANGER